MSRAPIKPPVRDARRRVWRGILEAVAQLMPISSSLATLYRVTHPPAAEVDRERWEDEVTQRLGFTIEELAAGTIKRGGMVESHNVSSWTDNGTGDVTISFICGEASKVLGGATPPAQIHITPAGHSFRVQTTVDGAPADADFWFVALRSPPRLIID
jgi:hypothetical protein